ncbi:hypothetical protein EVAR_72913_1, partial [Eumeta japonica]
MSRYHAWLAPFCHQSLLGAWHSEQVARSQQVIPTHFIPPCCSPIGTSTTAGGCSLEITLGPPTPWYRYYNPRIGLEEQSYSTAIGLLTPEDSVRHYRPRLSSASIPKVERQGVAPHQDQTCTRGE